MQLADAPVIPCVIIGTDAYYKVRSWLPLRRVRYGANFGEPITVYAPGSAGAADYRAAARELLSRDQGGD